MFFRSQAKREAEKLGLTGCVENLNDGSVRITAEGSTKELDEFQRWCHRGPPSAIVERVEMQEIPPKGFSTFEIRR